MNTKLKFVLFVFVAAIVGAINGIFGGGGGMLCVPILKVFLGLDDKKAHATAVLIMAIISIPTLVVYITTIPFNLVNGLLLTLGSLIGGLIGSKLLNKLSNKAINLLFIGLMLFSGLKLIF